MVKTRCSHLGVTDKEAEAEDSLVTYLRSCVWGVAAPRSLWLPAHSSMESSVGSPWVALLQGDSGTQVSPCCGPTMSPLAL